LVGQPAKIGKYDVLRLIGRGGMGVVYEALDPKLERHVAIKMILGATPGLLARFDREARSTGSLQHQNIVTIYEFGDQEGSPYLVMEYLEGMSLDTAISTGRALSLATKLSICVDVCNGLNYAHDRGIIHRDIKPGNVMLLEDGSVKIVDFGIARIGDTGISRTEVVGSLHYMSPEQFQSQPLDRRTDIFSTGVVLYQLLTGALPFQAAGGEAAVMYRIINEDPAPLSSYLQDYPVELDEILRKALAKNRDLRYPSARDLAFDLMAVVDREKHQEVQQWMKRADLAMQRTEWTKAEESLRQVLKVDKHHTPAHQLLSQVQVRIREQRKVDQVRQLRMQADEAFLDRRYDEALRTIDQAVVIDETNKDLLNLRQSIQEAKSRASRLKLALRRAEEAHHAGDLEEAKLAVREALEIDPYETSAKALQVVILKQVEEQQRQQQLRQLFDNARDQITSRNLTAAFQTLKEAEQVDPASVELYSLMKVVSAAREEQLRKSEMEKLTRDIEEALNREDYAAAVAIANEGLQRQPREQGLLKLKALAEKQQQRVQLKAYARDQFLAASGLLEAGRTSEALSTIENALRTIPGDTQLERLRDIVKDRLAADEAEERKRQLLGRAQEMAAAEKFDEAVRILESLRRDFPGTEEIEPLLERTRAAAKYAQMVAQALDRAQRLLSQGSTEQAVQFLEEKTLELSDARLFDLLDRARRQREQFQSGLQTSIEEGKRILQTHGAMEAARYLAAQPARYREIAEFHALAEVVSNRMAVEALDQELMGKTDPDSQVRLAEAALRANPGNEEIKKRLVTVRSRKEQIHAIAEQARTLEASRQYSEAAKELQPLRQLYPQYPSLEPEIRRLERLEEQRLSEGERRQLEQFQLALQRAIEEGKRILQRHGASEATKYLGTQPSKYRETQEFRAFAEVVAKRAAWEALDRDLAGNPDADAQIRLAEAALRQNPGNEEIGTRLAVLRSRKEQISAIAENAQALEASRQFGDAAKELRQFRQLHPQYPGLESEIGRLERLEEQRRSEDARRQLEQFQVDLQRAIEEGHRILQNQGASEAAKYLSLQPAKYREVPQYRTLAEVVANQLAGEALDQELSRNPDPDAQVRAAETALRANPGNEEIKKRLGAMRGRREQISAVTEKARVLESSRQYSEAAKELQQLRQLHPQYPSLESEIRRLERLAEQRLSEAARRDAEQFQLAVRGVIEEGQRILQKRGASETARYLGTQPAKYQETPEFRAFAGVIAKRVAGEALDQELAANTDPDAQVCAAEAALRANPANEEIKKRLAAVRSRREQVNTIVEKVRALEGSRRYSKAAKELQKMRPLYPQYPSLEPEIQRLEGLEEQSKRPQRVVEAVKTKVDRPSVEHREQEVGATVIMGQPRMGRPRMEEPPTDVAPAAPPVVREVQPGALPSGIAEPQVSQVSPRAYLSSKTWLIAVVAIVVVAGVGLVYVVSSRPTTVLVKVNPTPEDSRVAVDGVSCPVPCQLPLLPGKHLVVAEHDGYTTVTQNIQVPRGGSPRFPLTLSPVELPIHNNTGGGGDTGGSVPHDQGKGAKGGKTEAQGHTSGSGLSTKTESNDTKGSSGTPYLGPNSGGSLPTVAEVVIRNLPAMARVKVEGGDTHQADGSGLARFSVAVGNHTLDITADGYTSRTIQQSFAAGGPALDVSLDPDPEQQEWAKLESSTDSGALQAFLRKYPAGKHTEQAKEKLDKLDKLASSKGGGSTGTGTKNSSNLTDSGMISDTLGQLERAYSSKNVSDVCGIWPGCTRKDIEKVFKEAVAVSIKFQPSAPPEISGELASVVCSRARVTTYKGSPPLTGNDTVTIHLRKQNGKWRIDSIN
jgi:eukaryotic-like serine/threonine-protein kinase